LHSLDRADDHTFVIDAFCEFGHCGSTLRALDVSDPTAPREVGLLTVTDAVEDLIVRDGVAFMAARRTGLNIAYCGKHPILRGKVL
jgi:hypothetical protein